jgi:hypothetical protein
MREGQVVVLPFLVILTYNRSHLPETGVATRANRLVRSAPHHNRLFTDKGHIISAPGSRRAAGIIAVDAEVDGRLSGYLAV